LIPTLRSVANEFSDQCCDGPSRQVPYEDIEANPADYYDISKYDKDFIRNPLRPDVDIMDLASIALTLRKGDFDFYDHDVIQANILSHAKQLVAQGAKTLEGGDESASKITPEGDSNDLSRASDGTLLAGEEPEKEEGEEEGGEATGAGDADEITLSGTEAGKEEGGEETRAGGNDGITLSGSEAGKEEGAEEVQVGDGVTPPGNNKVEDESRGAEEERAGDDDENLEAEAESGRGRKGDDEDERERMRDDHDENMEGGAQREGVREEEDHDPNTEDEGKRVAESTREREGVCEDKEYKEEQEAGDGDEEVEGTIGSDDGLGLPADSIQPKSRRGESKPIRGLQTRGSKRKAELEGVRTTRSKVPKLSVRVKQPVYRRRARHL
jgi:hypothetical protein